MKNFIPPKKILGTIKINPKESAEEFYIGEANFAIEKVGENLFINIWVNSYHYELHGEKEVLIGDIGIEIMQPIKKELSKSEITQIDFPNDIDEVENGWEELYYGHFYQFEHLKITKWQISVMHIPDEELFKIDAKGYITDDIRNLDQNHYVECSFKTKLESKIRSKFNWNYSGDNENAKNTN